MEQVRSKPSRSSSTEVEDPAPHSPATDGAALKAELDELLDEVDAALEENAETFVKAYVQRGGQ